MSDTGASQSDAAPHSREQQALASALAETRIALGLYQHDVANGLGLGIHRIREVEGDWTSAQLTRIGFSFRILSYFVEQAADPNRLLADKNRTAVDQGLESIRSHAEIVRNQLREERRDELGAILSVDEELAEHKLRLAFSLRELREVNHVSKKNIVEKVSKLELVSLKEYEMGIGYQIADLILIREIIEKFPSQHSSYSYIYEDLIASVGALTGNRRRATLAAEQRRARADQVASPQAAKEKSSGVSQNLLDTDPSLAGITNASLLDDSPDNETQVVSTAIVAGRKACKETQSGAARFLADELNPSEFRHFITFIQEFERHGIIKSFSGVFYTRFLLNRYMPYLDAPKTQLDDFKEILDKRASEIRQERTVKLLARLGYSVEDAVHLNDETMRAVEIAISLQHVREIPFLTLSTVAKKINTLAGNKPLANVGKLSYLENTARYNLRQIKLAQLFLEACQVSEDISADPTLIHEAVIALLTAQSRRPPRRIRHRIGDPSTEDKRRGAVDTRYASLTAVQAQILGDLTSAGFTVEEFFPHVKNLISDQEKKIDSDRRTALRRKLRKFTELFPEVPHTSWEDIYGEEVDHRLYIALALNKLRITSDPVLTKDQLTRACAIKGEDIAYFYQYIKSIEEATWPDLPPQHAVNRVLEILVADEDTIEEVNKRIVALHTRKRRGIETIPVPSESSVSVDPQENLHYSLEIFSWLAAMHLEHRHLQSGRQGDYIAAFAAEIELNEAQLRHLLDPYSREEHTVDNKISEPNATMAERWYATNATIEQITSYVAPDLAEHLPEAREEHTVNQGSDESDEEYRAIWRNIGRLVNAHSNYLGDMIPEGASRREDQIRGFLKREPFQNIVSGNGAGDRESLLVLLNSWREILDATRFTRGHGSSGVTDPAPARQTSSDSDPSAPSPLQPAAEGSPALGPAPAGPVATSPVLPVADASGWKAYGRVFAEYQRVMRIRNISLAHYLGCSSREIIDIHNGHGYQRPELIAGATSFWLDPDATYQRRATAVSDSGWDEFGQLVRTLREVNGHSRGAFAEIINSFDVAVAEIESGAGAQYPSEVSAITASVSQFVAVHERPRGQAAAAPAPPDVSAPVVAPVARQPASERDDEAYQRSLEGRIGDRTIVDAGWPNLIVLLRRQRLNTKLTVEGWATSTGTSAELVRRMEESGGGHENKNLRAVLQLAQELGEEDRARAMLIVGEVKRLKRANIERQLRRTQIVLHFPGWDRTAWPGCGAFLQQQRELAELTVEELANLCGVPVAAFQEIWCGGGYEPSFRDAIDPGRIAFRDLRNDSATVLDKLRELNNSTGNDPDPLWEELHTLLHNEQTRDYHSYRQILESRKQSPVRAGDWQDLIVLAYQARRRSGPRREPVATTAGLPVATLKDIESGVAPLDHVSYQAIVALFWATKSGDDIPTDIKEKLQRLKTALANQAGGELPPSAPPSFRPRALPDFPSSKHCLSGHSHRR
ncbi:MAG: hypothetical protein DLM55_06185 [Acidimicrobiales bacterium]|nr:MAG: hypothetical protein DLM55_06185 [Acidimicrobiales bacterium]